MSHSYLLLDPRREVRQKFIVARNPRMISVLSLSFWLLTICASAVTCIAGVTSAL
jgi:hypothetical protein